VSPDCQTPLVICAFTKVLICSKAGKWLMDIIYSKFRVFPLFYKLYRQLNYPDKPLTNRTFSPVTMSTTSAPFADSKVRTVRAPRGPELTCANWQIEAAEQLGRVLWNDPATGVMRHAYAGYEIAEQCAREQGLNLPMKAV